MGVCSKREPSEMIATLEDGNQTVRAAFRSKISHQIGQVMEVIIL